MNKAGQQSILDDFNKHGSGITQPPPPITAPWVVVPSVRIASSVIADSRDVLTRADALGIGATTPGFKRFLPLTEAAKDRQNGPFRNSLMHEGEIQHQSQSTLFGLLFFWYALVYYCFL